MLIWLQLILSICFAGADKIVFKKEHLSPKISLSKDSLQNSIKVYSKLNIENALLLTFENINDIGQRNLKRNLRLISWI